MSRIFETGTGLIVFFSLTAVISLSIGLYIGYTW